MSKFLENIAVIVQKGKEAAQTLVSTPLRQAAAMWIVADVGIGVVGATPQNGPQNEFLVGYGVACTVANSLMMAFGDGRKLDAGKVKNPVLRTLNAYGEHTASYIQFGGMMLMVAGGLLPGGFRECNQLIKDFAINAAAIPPVDKGMLATGLLAVAGGYFQAKGRDTEEPRSMAELPRIVRSRQWHEVPEVIKNAPPYQKASSLYHCTNVTLFGTGIAYLMSSQHSLQNALLIMAAPVLYTLGNIQLGRSAKAKLKLDAPAPRM